MPQGVNRVFLIGHLGADPELRTTQAGKPVAELRLATNRRYNDKQGQTQEATEWHRIVVWDRLANLCRQYLAKGSQVFVEGRLQTRRWADKEGQTRYFTEVVAQQVVFLNTRRREAEAALAGEMPLHSAAADPTQRW